MSNVKDNHARKVPRIRVFEVGRVFLRDPAAPDGPLSVGGLRQPMRIAAAAYGPASEQWEAAPRAVDFFDVKADLEALIAPLSARFEAQSHPAFHPGRSARVLVDGTAAGWIGELHPKWQHKYGLPQAPVLFELDAEPLQRLAVPPAGRAFGPADRGPGHLHAFPAGDAGPGGFGRRPGRKTGDCALLRRAQRIPRCGCPG